MNKWVWSFQIIINAMKKMKWRDCQVKKRQGTLGHWEINDDKKEAGSHINIRGKHFPGRGHQWKNSFSVDEFGVFVEQKGFWCGWNKMKKEDGECDNVRKVRGWQITEGFKGNGNGFGFYSECDGKPFDNIWEKSKERGHWKPQSKSVVKSSEADRGTGRKIFKEM